MEKRRGTGLVGVAEVLTEVFRRTGIKRAVKRAEAVLLWPKVAGPETAKFTHANSLKDGILYVSVCDSETAMHLTLQRQRFVDVYRAKFAIKELRDIRFKVGALPEAQRAAPKETAARGDPQELAHLAGLLGKSELTPDLARKGIELAEAVSAQRARRKAEGWKPCRACGLLTDRDHICATCRRKQHEARLQSARDQLAADPLAQTPALCHEERLLAAHLAKSALKERMFELLPYVLADPGYKTKLTEAARAYIALELDKTPGAVDEDDYHLLDARVARALGRWQP